MNVIFTHDVFSGQVYGGISRYFSELLLELRQLGVKVDLGAIVTANEHLRPSNMLDVVKVPHIPRTTPARHLINAMYQRLLLRVKTFSLIHSTSYQRADAPSRTPVVVTAYDCIHERLFPSETGLIAQKRSAMEAAAAILCISEFTKSEVHHFYPEFAHKTYTVPLGISPHKLTDPIGPSHRRKQLLYVGGRQEYKNFERAVQAFAACQSRTMGFRLVVASQHPFKDQERLLIDRWLAPDECIRVAANDDELQYLYQQSTAFIFPSLMEGFGLPLLESMAQRCPCIVSNIPVFREICGSAAEYFDPLSIDSIAGAIDNVLLDEGQQRSFASKGIVVAATYSWTKTALSTLETYEMVLGMTTGEPGWRGIGANQ